MMYVLLVYHQQDYRTCYRSVMNIVLVTLLHNVKKSVCMFFKSSVNKHSDYANVYLSGNHIDLVQEGKHLGIY